MIRLLTALLASTADSMFHDWCTSVGIETPLASLRTTSESVAGRGVFAAADIREGDVVMRIPEKTVLHEHNAALYFPTVAAKLGNLKEKHNQRKKSRWRSILGRNHIESEFSDPSDWWQAELTLYSLACLEESDHPWSPWIAQWKRDDPMQRLYDVGASWTWRYKAAVSNAVKELHAMSGSSLSEYKLNAAVYIRLKRLEDMRKIFELDQSAVSMFGVLGSRAIELGDGIVGVLPMFDMVNHSNEPNLALSFDRENFELWGSRDIKEGEELFLRYTREAPGAEWDEDSAVWNLVQWGIPQPRKEQEIPLRKSSFEETVV